MNNLNGLWSHGVSRISVIEWYCYCFSIGQPFVTYHG